MSKREHSLQRQIQACCNVRYPLDETNKYSLINAVSPKALAYNSTNLGKNVEYKMQDFLFKKSGNLATYNNIPILSYQAGDGNGQVIGSSINVKEITVKVLVFMDIPIFTEDSSDYSIRIPQVTGKLALIRNKTKYSEEQNNFVKFGDVFADVDSETGETIVSTESYEKIGSEERYDILYKTSFALGSYMANYPTTTSSGVIKQTDSLEDFSMPLQTSQPFFYHGVCHLNLWDHSNLTTTNESLSEKNSNKSEEMGIFSKGVEMDFSTDVNKIGETDNKIDYGSLWVTVKLSTPEIEVPEGQPEAKTTTRYYTRVIYT